MFGGTDIPICASRKGRYVRVRFALANRRIADRREENCWLLHSFTLPLGVQTYVPLEALR